MPITGPSSYPQTTEQFLAHWGLANAALPPASPLSLPGQGIPPGPPVAVAGLETLYNSLSTKRVELQSRLNNQEIARGAISNQKTALLLRANQFNEAVRALLSGSKYEAALPNVPGILVSQAPFTEPLDDASDVWVQINADAVIGADITLLGDYTQPMFEVDVTALKTEYRTFNTADVHTGFTRSERNGLQNQIYPLLKSYRQVLPTKFAATHALVQSMPKLTPDPGSTPAAVTLTFVWVPELNKVRFTFTKSSADDFAEYEFRFTAGPNYSTDDDTVIGNITDINTLEFLTDAGLTTPGVTATFKVFVRTTTGNEKGSNTVSVTRPAAPVTP